MESRFLFRTALSKSILPFALYKPDLVVLPITIETDATGAKSIQLHHADALRKIGCLDASRWFQNVENIWKIHRTEKNKNISSEDYVNWQNKLTEQDLNADYLVLYNSSAKDANATVVKRSDWDLAFLIESVTYVCYTENVEEAYYLTAILNSAIPNERMKAFQAKGLFGERHVHKKILDVYFPAFSASDAAHVALAGWSEQAHKKAAAYLRVHPPQQALSALHLGRLRLDIKKHVAVEMKEIDTLVKGLIG
jgi:hypothetical protein